MIEVKHDLKLVLRMTVIVLLSLILALTMTGILFYQGLMNGRRIAQVADIANKNTASIAEITAKQDIYRQQYLDSIKTTIDAMNALQRENADPEKIKRRGIVVPKIPVPGMTTQHTTEDELRRIPQPGPDVKPTPIIQTKVKVKKVYVTPKPTPKPMKWPWSKTTR